MARWSYRITIEGHKSFERLVSDHFSYSDTHYDVTNRKYPFDKGPPDELIIKYALRILFDYRTQNKKTGKIFVAQPSIMTIIDDPDSGVSADDDDLINSHLPDDPRSRGRKKGEVMFLPLEKVTHKALKAWMEQYGDQEFRVRAILKAALARAFEAGKIPGIPPVF